MQTDKVNSSLEKHNFCFFSFSSFTIDFKICLYARHFDTSRCPPEKTICVTLLTPTVCFPGMGSIPFVDDTGHCSQPQLPTFPAFLCIPCMVPCVGSIPCVCPPTPMYLHSLHFSAWVSIPCMVPPVHCVPLQSPLCNSYTT